MPLRVRAVCPGAWQQHGGGGGLRRARGRGAQQKCVSSAAALAGPFFVALVGGAHMDSRHRRGIGGELTPERDAATSHVPFAALLAGRQSWEALGAELNVPNAQAGVTLAAALALLRAARRA